MNYGRLIILGTILASCVPFAHADRIYGEVDTNGTATIATTSGVTTIAFGNIVAGHPVGHISGDGQADFSNFSDGTSFNYIATPVTLTVGAITPVQLFSVTENGVTLDFFLTNILDFTVGSASAKGAFDAIGYITETGNPTQTVIDFSLTNSSKGTGSKSFSTSLIAISPEPSSLTLLGTGALSVVGFAFRKRVKA